ncbi:MAG: hypothetical protein WKF86_02205 [Acidimicrobiales bacterium]
MRTWGVVVAGVVGLCCAGWAAGPATADEGVRLTATAGWGGRCHSGQPILVRARITADRLVSGVLTAEALGRTSSTTTVTEVPVEVAGGTEKEVVLVASSPAGCVGVQVKLQEAKSTTTVRANVSDAGDTVLLGLLPGALRGQAAPASTTARTGVAAVSRVEPELIDRAGAIDSLDSLGATAADLEGLSAGQRRSLATWVASGGTLLVDSDDPAGLCGVPDAWRPAAGGRVESGRGQVRLTGTSLRDGRIEGLAEPGARATGSRGNGGFGLEENGGLGSFLQERSGLRVVSLPVILGALGLYVALAGPGTRIGLRRLGRLQLTWMVIPLTAVAFAGLAVVGGDVLRRGGKPTHVSVLETEIAGSRSRSFVGVPTRSKASVVANLPAGWFAGGQGVGGGSGPSTLRATPTGQRLKTTGQPGGFVVLSAVGPSTIGGRLSVRLDPDGRRGTLRNEMQVPLDDVAVFAPGGLVTVGRVEAGGMAPFTTPSGQEGSTQQMLARQARGGRNRDVPDAELLTSLVSGWSPIASGEGGDGIIAVGRTDRLDSPFELRGRRPPGTTLVIGRPEGGPPSGESVGNANRGMKTTRFVVDPAAAYRLSLVDRVGRPAVGKDRIPPDRFGNPSPVGAAGGTGAEVLVAGRWVPTSNGTSLPQGASADGVVYLRTGAEGPVNARLVRA